MMKQSESYCGNTSSGFVLVVWKKVSNKKVVLNALPLKDEVSEEYRSSSQGHLRVKECRVCCGEWFVGLPIRKDREQIVKDPS